MPKKLIPWVIVLLVSLSGHASAANYSNPVDGVFRGIYGSTISIEVPSLVAKSPVFNEDQNGDLFFQLKADTSYRNFNQLTDLKYGDPVRIEYTQDPTGKNKQMVASSITKLDSQVVVPPVNVVTAANNPVAAPAGSQTIITTTTTRVNSQ